MSMKSFLIILCVFFTSISIAQQTDYVDFISVDAGLEFVSEKKEIKLRAKYTFKILKAVDSIYLDAKNTYHYELHDSSFKGGIHFSGKDKIVVRSDNFEVGKTNGYEALANGKLIDKQVGDSLTIWKYDMKKPMSSYLVAIAIGKYNKKTETSKSGIPLEYYYYPEDSLKVEPTYRYSKQMFDFLEEEIGFAYPWQNYKQVPVHDFLYSGMENTSLTIFSDAFVVDSIGFNDRNYVSVNAHELAHQWFGDLVTAKSGEHHWLQEGFATYYALLAERDIFGDDYFYFKLLESVLDLSRQDLTGKGTSLLDAKASSLTFYQRGAFALHALKAKVGDAVFKKAVKNYLTKYQFGSVETKDFIAEVQRLHGKSLTSFVNYWIVSKDFPYEQAFELLKRQSVFVNEYAIVDCEAKSSKCAEQLKYYISDEAKAKIISQVPDLVTC